MPLVVVILVLLGGVGVEVFRFLTRRQLVVAQLGRDGFEPVSIRYRFEPWRVNWNTYYGVTATDRQGREWVGVAVATGFLRRRAWIEWR